MIIKWKKVTAVIAGTTLLASAVLVNLPSKKHIETVTAAGNSKHTIEDVRNLQDFLLAKPTEKDLTGADYDMNDDGRWDVFDLCLMKREVLQDMQSQDSKILVAYFAYSENIGDTSELSVDAVSSASLNAHTDNENGNTQLMAEIIADELGADIFSIQVKEPYNSDYRTMAGFARDEKTNDVRPALTAKVDNIDEYDVVFIGAPVWWASLPQPVLTFLDKNDLSGKTVIPFGIHLGSGWGSNLTQYQSAFPDADFLEGFTVSADTSNEKVRTDFTNWLRELELPISKESERMLSIKDIPSEYKQKIQNGGEITELKYETSNGSKHALVYTPANYDESKKYNIFYLMHGGGGSPENIFGGAGQSTEMKNILDNMIANGDLNELIVVAPTFYPESDNDSSVANAAKLTAVFTDELTNYLIPAAESTYSTYAGSASKYDLISSREHRAFGGFSMGSVTTWYTFVDCLDYFKYYMPISGDCWAVEQMGGQSNSRETAELLDSVVKNSYYSTTDFYICAVTGTNDIAYDAMTAQIEAMKSCNSFDFSENGNVSYILKEGGIHDYANVRQYLYSLLPIFWK